MRDAAGDPDEARSGVLLAHAAGCKACARLLAQAIANSPGVESEEEASWLEGLPSSTPAGQRKLAEAMQRAVAESSHPLPIRVVQPNGGARRWFGWPVFAMGAALLVCGVAWVTLHRPSNEQLLATAYDQHRLTELHLGDGHAVPLESPTRGTEVAASSSQLLEVKLRTQKRMEENPNDASLRQTLGHIALVEHNGAAALRQFEMAQALSPDLKGLDRDLGAAWFELAESGRETTDYARAIDFFSRSLQKTGNTDAAVLFNRGLAWERQSVYTEAIKDYQAALAAEKDAGWRAEIERRLQAVRNRSADSGQPGAPVNVLTPASLLAQSAEAPGDYELYLLTASRKWLPARGTDIVSANALRKLAVWGEGHHDAWLSEMLRTTPGGKESEAEQVLAAALDASNRGAADAALEAATTASSLFKAVGNRAGAARADAEIVYSQHRRNQAADCLQKAHALQNAGTLRAYSTMRLYVALEVSSCLAMEQDIPASLAVVTSVALSAREYGLPISQLRALGFAAEANNDIHETALSWKIGTEGLAEAEKIRSAFLRRYQLLFGMKVVAAKLGLYWTAAGLSDAATVVALRTENLETHAYALEQLGVDRARADDPAGAAQSFQRADAVLQQLPAGASRDHYLADWNTERAAFRVRRPEDLPGVLRDFERAEPSYRSLDSYRTRLDYYVGYADLLLKAKRTEDALAKGWYAVQQAEVAQSNSKAVSEKEGAAEVASDAYLDVVRGYLQQGKPDEALRMWLWFQAAPYRLAEKTEVGTLRKQLPALPQTEAGRVTLVFARLDNQYVAWALSPGKPVRVHTVTRPAKQVETRGETLLHLCADPKSSPRDLSVLGEGLYADLVAPFEDLVQTASVLQLNVDPSLATLPFAALQHGGRYLGLERPLLFYSAGWSTADARTRGAITAQEQIPEALRVLVLRQKAAPGQEMIPEDYDESARVAASFAHAEERGASLWRSGNDVMLAGDASLRGALPQADLLHYTGHGLNVAAARGEAVAGGFALQARSLPHCRLAVLAACESLHEMENPGNDVPSFARTLLRAGASHVLATQWDVDSRATRELMVHFYAELGARHPSPEALLAAQRSLYSQVGLAHPYYWSPFQLVAQ